MSDSDYSDSSDDNLPMKPIIKVSDIRTICELYKSSVLKISETQRYQPNTTLLNRVSLLQVNICKLIWSKTERLYFSQGDITKLEVDSIVNAANESLLGWSYVSFEVIFFSLITFVRWRWRRWCHPRCSRSKTTTRMSDLERMWHWILENNRRV